MTRDFNKELKDNQERKYGYSFDYDVIHPYMIEAFKPFFLVGNVLELGSYTGRFTERLLPHFRRITCVEASEDAISEAKKTLQGIENLINFHLNTFEEVKLYGNYDNIILTHVLEHVDDPVFVLKRINDEWLMEGGRLFLACPNANAPSRQIAVKMGLIPHTTAVTPGEVLHGHKRTYTLEALERDAVKAGLKVIYRSGIFFKALANFQWDLTIEHKITSQEYLDGCYTLGQQYPDLCSSIFLVCEKGEKV